MSDLQISSGTDQQQRDEAISRQREISDNLVKQQQQVRDELTKQALQGQHAQYQSWLSSQAGQHQNQLMPAHPSELPMAPREPLPVQGSAQDVERGANALQAYKDTGFLAAGGPTISGPQATAGDQALAEEKAFRDRQQQLADKITDPNTSHEQRERLELVKAAEFHDHKASQWENVSRLQQELGYPDKSVAAANEKRDHHKEQAALVANQLYAHDQKMGMAPKQVEARMGHAAGTPPLQHNAQSQKELSRDPHIQALASAQSHQEAKPAATPALQRLQQRREEARQAHSGQQPSAYVQAQLAEAKGREKQIEEAKSAQVETRSHNQAEAERQAMTTR